MPKKSNAKRNAVKSKHAIHTKELSLGELLSEGWQIYKSNFKLFLTIVLLVYIPVNLLSNLFENITWVFEFVIGIICSVAAIYATYQIVNKNKPNAITALKQAVLLWPNAIITSLLATLIMFVGFSPLIIMYLLGDKILSSAIITVIFGSFAFIFFIMGFVCLIQYGVYYTFIIPAVAIAGKKYKQALDLSKSLVKGIGWRVFSVMFVLTVLITLAGGIILSPFMLFDNLIVNTIGGTLFDIIFVLRDIILTLFFINLTSIAKKTKN
jgi:hypothetical protein